MADLENQGVSMVAEGVDKYAADLDKGDAATQKSQKVINDFSKSVDKLFTDLSKGASVSTIVKDFQNLASSGGKLIDLFGGLGAAGSGAGASIVAGATAAIGAIVAIGAAASAAALAIAGISSAINQAVALGSQLHNIQNATGASASAASGIFAAAKISGTDINAVTGSLQALELRVGNLGAKSEAAFGKMSDATDKANKAIGRLNEDYARSTADITTGAADRIAELNKNLAESYAAMIEKQKESEADFIRNRDEGRAASAQRIGDIEQAASERIAGLNQSLSRLDADNAREREKAAQDLADSITDIQSDLAKKVASLDDKANEDRNRAVDAGAKQQASIEEDLQKQLVSIEQKYTSQRQSLQDKIYDPNTNPILRNYYKTQIGTLNKLQKAEENSARSGASAKEDAARRDTAAQLAEVQTRLDKEKALVNAAAQEAIAKRQKDAGERATERQREYDQQRGDLQAQIAKENAQRDEQIGRERANLAMREADQQRSFDKQNAQAQAAYDKQVASAADAQLKIEAETTKRLDNEKRQYDRQLEDINASLAASLSGGAAAAADAINPVARALETLGVSAADFEKLDVEGKINLIGGAVTKLISEGKLDEARTLLEELFGPGQAAQLLDFYKQAQNLKDIGFTQDQIDNLTKYKQGLNNADLQLQVLVASIGVDFLPIAQEFLDWAIAFWKDNGPAVTQALRDIAQLITGTVVPAMRDVRDWFVRFLASISDTYKFIKGSLEIAFGTLATAATNVWNKIKPLRDLVDSLSNVAMAGLSVNIKIAAGAFDIFKKAASDVYNFLDKYLGPGIETIKKFGFDVLATSIGLVKKALDGILDLSGKLATFFDGIASDIRGIQLPSWLTGGAVAPTYSSGNGGSGFGRTSVTTPQTYSPPASSGQIAATYSTISSTSSNSAMSATIHQTFNGKVDAAGVGDATANALFKQGFSVRR